MKLIQKLTAAGLAALMTAGLAACGAAPAGSASAASSSGTAGDEITFMIPDWGVPSDELLAQFRKETGINVVVNVVDWDSIRDKISVGAVGGAAAADVVEVDWSWAGEFANAGWLEPLTLDDDTVKDIPTLANFTIDGKILAVPYANDYRIAYYNTKHFAAVGCNEAPKTWDEVYDAVTKIKAQGVCQYPYAIPLNAAEAATTSLTCLTIARSGLIMNDDGTLNQDAVQDSMSFISTLLQKGLIDPSLTTTDGQDAYRKVLSGEASFMVGPTSFVARSYDPEQCSIVGDVASTLLPGKTDVSAATTALPEAVGVLAASQHKEAAQKFVEWYTSPDIQVAMNKEQSAIPTRTSVLSQLIGDGTIKNPGVMLKASTMIASAYPNGVPSYYSEMSNIMANDINKMATGAMTADKAAAEMIQKTDALAKGN